VNVDSLNSYNYVQQPQVCQMRQRRRAPIRSIIISALFGGLYGSFLDLSTIIAGCGTDIDNIATERTTLMNNQLPTVCYALRTLNRFCGV